MFQAWINHNTFEKISEHDPKQAHPPLIKKTYVFINKFTSTYHK